jgi:hypothetical protein
MNGYTLFMYSKNFKNYTKTLFLYISAVAMRCRVSFAELALTRML